ncbi:YybH family protein [Gloeothece verrucosa]|uniref:Ketosteroid isomerase-like protein n=1 Tax=Gloeothece verrucosa (strain PCC 7822) TaxID=497965 RepID=E0UKN5_GLOV7|nr:DUF4440 domain-containing protein [Gloeothece verrucosa]ADN17515.1 ketosteroid isomerase-like protein [Gloeothece verrucosa PCC 7822]
MDSDKQAIQKVFEVDYPTYVRNKDRENYGTMYTENALWMPPNAPDRCGIPDILIGYDAAIGVENKQIDPTFTAEEIHVIGDLGYVLGISNATITTTNPDGTSSISKVLYRALWLMKKEQDTWKIHRQIWNVKP